MLSPMSTAGRCSTLDLMVVLLTHGKNTEKEVSPQLTFQRFVALRGFSGSLFPEPGIGVMASHDDSELDEFRLRFFAPELPGVSTRGGISISWSEVNGRGKPQSQKIKSKREATQT
jgi:hypothetical protein